MRYLIFFLVIIASPMSFADDDYSFRTEDKHTIIRALHQIEEIKDSLIAWQLAYGITYEIKKLLIEAIETEHCVYKWKAVLESNKERLSTLAGGTRFYIRRGRKCLTEYKTR
jgi:hypothetical protein